MATSNQFEKSPALWWIVAGIVALNLWYDYHHPGWFVFDAIILVILVISLIAKWLHTPRNPLRGTEN
jgi:hypothetical protein